MNLTEKDIQFLESWYTPVEFAEVMFHDFNNFTAYKKGKFGDVRLYQYSMLSDEPLIDFELTAEHHGLNKKEEFQLRKNVGDLYCFGARKFGKTKISQELDLLVYLITGELGKSIAFSSVDLVHLKQVLDPVKNALGNHIILKNFVRKLKGAPDFQFELKDNTSLSSVNFNLNSTTPGRQWFGKHVFRVYIEENSMESEEVYDKRKDALSEFGAVFRCSGMCDFTPYSPPGKAFYKLENQKFILNLSQFVNPFWDEKEKKDRIDEYGGEESIGYKVFVKGEVVEDGVTALDMKRIRDNCYMLDRKGNFKKKIKRFEINKDNFKFWRNLIVVQRPENAERIFISADIGARVTELIIHSEVEKEYEYIYNITLLNLTQQEVEIIFKHVIKKLNCNVIAIDCGDGEGRGIYSGFELEFPKSNLVYYDGSMKIKVGYEYEEDENGNKEIKTENGEVIYKYEKMSTFSVRRLKNILYSGRCKIPEDFKTDIQFTKVIEVILNGVIRYKCLSTQGDHLFDAWRVFFIAQWLKCDFDDSEDIEDDNWGIGAIS